MVSPTGRLLETLHTLLPKQQKKRSAHSKAGLCPPRKHSWCANLLRFLKDSPLGEALGALGDDPDRVYAQLSVAERVAILKWLCEAQFDDNDALVERSGEQDFEALVRVRLTSGLCRTWD